MKQTEMVAEIENALKVYDEAGLVDRISINKWIKNALKEFGANIMERTEGTIEVINGVAMLPDNFYSLGIALKCDPAGYTTEGEDAKSHLQSAFLYKYRTEVQLQWDNQAGNVPCIEGEDCNTIVEEIHFHDKGTSAKLYYGNIEILKLVQGYKKVKCDKGCPNLGEVQSPYEISQQGNFFQCNFDSGIIYLRYRGLPTDEDGGLLIPEIQRNKLQEYIQYTCIRRTLEDIWLAKDDPDVERKLQYYGQKESQAYAAAKNDSIVEGMSGWKSRIKANNRRQTQKFDVMITNI